MPFCAKLNFNKNNAHMFKLTSKVMFVTAACGLTVLSTAVCDTTFRKSLRGYYFPLYIVSIQE